MSLSAILRLWLPLALSFELMMLEGPAVQAAIGRLPSSELNLAAWGLTMSISLLLESPIIMLLTTATALVRDRDSYVALRRFMITLLIGCTVITGLVAFTPLFGFISATLMRQPEQIVNAARPAMWIMLFWSAAIGWRRFYQGVLVGHGHTRPVTLGTGFRLLTALIVAFVLASQGNLPGVQVGAWTLMAAVIVEAIATTLFASPVLHRDVKSTSPTEEGLSQRAIFRFHAPLALTTVLMLLAQPLTAAALARLANPVESLAVWPVVAMVLLVMRGWCFALQEITVSLGRNPKNLPNLKRAAFLVGLATTVATIGFAVTPLLDAYLGPAVLNLPQRLWADTRTGIAIAGLLPLITALGTHARGLLVAGGATREVYRGMSAGIATLALLLAVGVVLRLPAMWVASGAITLASLTEYIYLSSRVSPSHAPESFPESTA